MPVARQQRRHLVDGVRVVQQNQHPPPGDSGPIHRRHFVKAVRDRVRADIEGAQQLTERLRRCQGYTRVVPTQLHVQLAVRELVGSQVRGLHSQGGLTDSTHPGHCDQSAAPPLEAQCGQNLVEFRGAGGEVCDGRWKLPHSGARGVRRQQGLGG
jgi:hypothetical protein